VNAREHRRWADPARVHGSRPIALTPPDTIGEKLEARVRGESFEGTPDRAAATDRAAVS
jgi:hypothetical protein